MLVHAVINNELNYGDFRSGRLFPFSLFIHPCLGFYYAHSVFPSWVSLII